MAVSNLPIFAANFVPGEPFALVTGIQALPLMWNFTQGMQGWVCADSTSGAAKPDGLYLLAHAAAPAISTRINPLPAGRYAVSLNGDFSACTNVRLSWRSAAMTGWSHAPSVTVAPNPDEPDAIDLPFTAGTAVDNIRVEFACATPGAPVFLSGASLHRPAGE